MTPTGRRQWAAKRSFDSDVMKSEVSRGGGGAVGKIKESLQPSANLAIEESGLMGKIDLRKRRDP